MRQLIPAPPRKKEKKAKSLCVGCMLQWLLESTSLGQKTKMFYLITVMIWSSTCKCPESYVEDEFCCAALTSWKQKYFYLLCNVLVWKLAASSPFCVRSVLGLNVLEGTCQSKSKLCKDNLESVCFCPSVVTPVCLFLDRILQGLPAGRFLKENRKCEHSWPQRKNMANGFSLV